jgi:hypothetical protein
MIKSAQDARGPMTNRRKPPRIGTQARYAGKSILRG